MLPIHPQWCKNASIFVNLRDGQSGKVTVDDYGARTGKSPGMMRQLNINGDLYVGKFLLSPIVHLYLKNGGRFLRTCTGKCWPSSSCLELPLSLSGGCAGKG